MASFGDTLSGLGTGAKNLLGPLMLFIVIGTIVVLFAGILSWYFFIKRRWNLNVEIKLLRGNAGITIAEWGKGMYNAKRGVVFIKRPGFMQGSIPMEVFDIKKYLQGTNILTVIQLGPESYKPVLNNSWTEHSVTYVDDETGEEKEVKESVLDIKIDTGLNKAWKSAWEASAKRAYSLASFFHQFQTPLSVAIVIVAVFIGFAMMWTRLGSICG